MEKSKEKKDIPSEGVHDHGQKRAHEDSQAKKVEELTETLQRLQAEFENYKKYIARQQQDYLCYAKADTIAKILPVLDSFEGAFKHRDEPKEFSKGVELIFQQLTTTLQQEGLRKIETVGKKADPFQHEVLLTVENARPEGTIVEELQAGYLLGDKVLRHAKVKISKPKQHPAVTPTGDEGAKAIENPKKEGQP